MLFLLISLCFQESAQADLDPSAVENRIERIDTDLSRLRHAISQVSKSTSQVSVEVNQLELQRAILNSEIEKSELLIQLAEREQQRNEQQRADLKAKSATQEEAIGKRLAQLYKRGRLGYAHLFLTQSRLDDLLGAFHYARHMTERDHQAFLEYRRTFEQLELVEKALVVTRDRAQAAVVENAEKRSELDQLLKKRTERLNHLRRQRDQKRSLARELELEREELDMMIKRLQADDPSAEELRVPVTRYKGRLDWPATGPILRKFGVYRDPEFKTKRRQKGVDIQAQPGSLVKAMYSGRVLYADWFKSYGNLIIIDHGENITSFYAHNERLLVETGQFVERNTIIARSGDTGSLEGPFLHFEVRAQGQPENPSKWLKPLQH